MDSITELAQASHAVHRICKSNGPPDGRFELPQFLMSTKATERQTKLGWRSSQPLNSLMFLPALANRAVASRQERLVIADVNLAFEQASVSVKPVSLFRLLRVRFATTSTL